VPLHDPDQRPPTITAASIFTTVRETEPLLGKAAWRRHLRLSDDHYLRSSHPAAFAAAAEQIRAFVREKEITQAIVFGQDLAAFAPALEDCAVVLDVCDSRTLTLRRELDDPGHRGGRMVRWKGQLELLRTRAAECHLPDRFACVTAISEPDRRQLLDLHGPADNVHVIRNGVPDRLLGPLGPPGRRRGVAFWGNLAFGPNDEALRFFVEQVYLPFLAAQDVELCVVGHHAPEWLVDISRREPGIVVTGFVPDLAAAVDGYPIMINPMRTGSGLKNKVLEAFGLGLAVISTRLGVDALGEVGDDEHVVLADEPADLAREVLALLGDDGRQDRLRARAHDLVCTRYPWDTVGKDWRALLGGTGAPAYQVT
jgi:glycosyltransferase involved in cell wall biosynthesis